MASLQIRELPDDVYEILSHRAQSEGRSLAQQAIADLRKVPEIEARQQRLETIERLRRRFEEGDEIVVQTPPEVWVRQDRDR